MNRIILCAVCTALIALVAVQVQAQAPITPPYVQNFDGEAQCPTGAGAPCVLIGDFENLGGDTADWTADSNGTFSAGTGPSGDNTTGSGVYLYFETSTPIVAGDSASVASPVLDIAGAANPQISFWYHMLGTDMGTMHVDVLQQLNTGADGVTAPGAGTDGVFLSPTAQFTAGGVGDTITVSGSASSDGVYTITAVIDDFSVSVTPNFAVSEGPVNFVHERRTNDIIPAFTDNLDLWQQIVIPLTGTLPPFGNGSTFRAIIRGTDGPGFTSDMAIDDFEFLDPVSDDIATLSVDSPAANVCAGDYTVSATLRNFGLNPASNFPVLLIVDGNPVTAEVIAGPIAPSESFSVTFGLPATLTPGSSIIDVTAGLAGDLAPGNDTASLSVNVTAAISSFPYVEDFEGGTAGWYVEGSASWAFGTPANVVITGAASGVNAFGTGNLTGSYNVNEQGAVRSPCFDLSSLQNPYVRMNIWWDSEFSWDGSNLQYSTDGGLSWIDVGAFGDDGNWYTDNTINSAPGGSQSGWTGATADVGGSGGYVTAVHELENLAGVANVEFRMNFASDTTIVADGVAFDDFEIFEPVLPFPGSFEDLTLKTGVNGVITDSIGDEIKQANVGDFLDVLIESPLGGYTGAPYALLADPYVTAGGPPTPINAAGFPEVHISANVSVIIDGNDVNGSGGLQAVIGSNGELLTFAVLQPTLSGVSVLVQALVLDQGAANGFFAITDGRVFEIQ